MSQVAANLFQLDSWSESAQALTEKQYTRFELTDAHRESLSQIAGSAWNAAEHIADIHTVNVASVYPEFKTNSPGTDLGTPNAFLSPTKQGWRVVRRGAPKEHDSWTHTETSTVCYIEFPATPKDDLTTETIRRVHGPDGACLGWAILTDAGLWARKSSSSVKNMLKAEGYLAKEADVKIGRMEASPWVQVNQPLRPEYPDPSKREWNRFSVQFKVEPKQGNHRTWDAMYRHLGKSLDATLETLDIENLPDGATYLKLFHALALRNPTQRLPYIATTGPQDSGKTTLLACLRHLLTNSPTQAVVTANNAVTSRGNFNGEFEGALFGAIEEIAVSREQFQEVKNWVTAFEMQIHAKGSTPFTVPNTMHLVQTCNDISFVPLQVGDTRITVCEVEPLTERLPADEFDRRLAEEAPAMLWTLLNMPLPPSQGRLWLPVLQTECKTDLQEMGRTDLEEFFASCVTQTNSKETIKLGDFISIVSRNIPTVATRQAVVKAIKDAGGKVKEGRGRYKYVHNLTITEPKDE